MKIIGNSLLFGCAAMLGLLACGGDFDGQSEGELGSFSQELTTITLSGTVKNASNQGIAGVVVTLAGSSEGSRVTNASVMKLSN